MKVCVVNPLCGKEGEGVCEGVCCEPYVYSHPHLQSSLLRLLSAAIATVPVTAQLVGVDRVPWRRLLERASTHNAIDGIGQAVLYSRADGGPHLIHAGRNKSRQSR